MDPHGSESGAETLIFWTLVKFKFHTCKGTQLRNSDVLKSCKKNEQFKFTSWNKKGTGSATKIFMADSIKKCRDLFTNVLFSKN